MAKVITLDEAALFLKIHPSTVYRLLKKGTIPAFKVGTDWRFNLESIEKWIARREADYQDRFWRSPEAPLCKPQPPLLRG
jgi:excisionase family DNA binding protein